MNRQSLVTILEMLKPALADNQLIAVFQCYQFTRKRVLSYNDALGIATNCHTDHAFAVNGEILLGLLKNSNSEDVVLSPMVSGDENELHVKAGRSTFKLPFFTEDEFLFEEPADKWDVVIPITKKLCDGIESCLSTTSKSEAQPAFMGVCLRQTNKSVMLYSTDGDAITSYNTGIEPSKVVNYSLIKVDDLMLSNAFCEALLKLSNESSGELFLNKEWAKAVLDNGYTIYGRLMVIDNPVDHEGAIKHTIKTDPAYFPIPDELEPALSRARILADQESAKTAISIENGRLKLVTETRMGVVRDSIAIRDVGSVEANVSAELLHRIVQQCTRMAVMDNCTAFSKDDELFQLVSNLGD